MNSKVQVIALCHLCVCLCFSVSSLWRLDSSSHGGSSLQEALRRVQEVDASRQKRHRRGHRQVRPLHRSAHRRGKALTFWSNMFLFSFSAYYLLFSVSKTRMKRIRWWRQTFGWNRSVKSNLPGEIQERFFWQSCPQTVFCFCRSGRIISCSGRPQTSITWRPSEFPLSSSGCRTSCSTTSETKTTCG